VTEEDDPAESSGTVASGVMDEDAQTRRRPSRKRRPPSSDRRRFVNAVTVGLVAALVPYLWILWDVWDKTVEPLRRTFPGGNFYDLQGRAMLHGHLSVPTGSLGVEGFVHDGHTYTYFGIFPSLIRLPVLLLTSRLDGRLTAPYMLLGWLVAGVFCALLLWRLRMVLRGPVALGRMEAASYGLLVATMMGGSVFVYLASNAWVYDEDLVWSVALTVGSMFALLGVMERPSRGRMWACGGLVLAASLNRLPTGYACIAGALLVAGWLALGRGGDENRRWFLPMVAAGLVPLVALTVVNELKFGVAFGVPLNEQVFTHVNAHRRAALAASGGKGYGLQFLPSTALAYLWPGGIRLTSVFPFVTLPAEPARAVGSVILDRANRTASLTASMPLLFLLSCWGVFAAFRRRTLGRGSMTRLIVVAAALGCGAVMIFDYISDRYLADFLPFLIVASAVGLVDVWGRTHNWRRPRRRLLVGATAVLTVASMAVNLAVASTPQGNWASQRAIAYVKRQVSFANLLGLPLTGNIVHGEHLPYYAPADTLFDVGDCRALYISTGDTYATFPMQQLEHKTWFPLERPADAEHRFSVKIEASLVGSTRPFPIMTIGRDTISMMTKGSSRIRFDLSGPHINEVGKTVRVKRGEKYAVVVTADPYLQVLTVAVRGKISLDVLLPSGRPTVLPPPSVPGMPMSFRNVTKKPKSEKSSLCQAVVSAGRG